jgi:hypothetical protein
MARTIVLALALLLAAWGAGAQQTSFSNTVQDFRPSVIDFREDGLAGCFRNGVLIDPSPADLEVGDIFIDVDGNAKKVVSVQRDGNDLYIDTVRPRLDEVYLYVEIPFQLIVFNEDNFLPDTLPGFARSADATASKATFKQNFEKEIYNKPPALIKLTASAELTSGIAIGFAAPYYSLTSWMWWKASSWRQNSGYIEGSLGFNLALNATLTIVIEGSKESSPVLLYGFGTPTPGISAGLGLFTKSIMEGSLNLTVPVDFNVSGSAGAKCTLAGQVPVIWPTDLSTTKSLGYSVSIKPVLSAEAKLKQKFYLGADITVVGIKITEFEAGGGPYVKLSGTVNGNVSYSSASGFLAQLDAQASGEIGLFLDVSGKVYDGKWAVNILSKEIPLVTLSKSGSWTSPFKMASR